MTVILMNHKVIKERIIFINDTFLILLLFYKLICNYYYYYSKVFKCTLWSVQSFFFLQDRIRIHYPIQFSVWKLLDFCLSCSEFHGHISSLKRTKLTFFSRRFNQTIFFFGIYHYSNVGNIPNVHTNISKNPSVVVVDYFGIQH